MQLFLSWLAMSLAVAISAYLIPGVSVGNFFSIVVAALVLGILNAILKPILILLTLPVNIFTLGLFTFVINAVIILIAGAIVPGFSVAGFWWAMLFSIVLSIFNSVIGMMIKE